MSKIRSVHAGLAAVSAALAATLFGIVPAVRAVNSSPASFVSIVPCRLADTRAGADNVGPRATPLGGDEVVPFTVRGQNGQCNIPTAATAIVSNVTAVGATAASFVTLYPADAAARPKASNLNLVPGAPPTPNQVTVGLSNTGVVNAFNRFGSVDLIIDIVGYFQPAGGGGGNTIPSGTTVAGTIQANTYVGGATIEFAQPAPTPLTTADVGFAPGVQSGQINPNCTGNVGAPTAPAGKVCLYTNLSMPGPFTAGPIAATPAKGFIVTWPAQAPPIPASPVLFVWAYTAP